MGLIVIGEIYGLVVVGETYGLIAVGEIFQQQKTKMYKDNAISDK